VRSWREDEIRRVLLPPEVLPKTMALCCVENKRCDERERFQCIVICVN